MKRLLVLFTLLANTAFGYINIYPTFFDKRIDNEGSYQEFKLYNQTNDKIMYRIYVEDNPEDKDMSMVRWMNFYPRSMTLEPGEEGMIKLNIASYGDIPEGEYSALLGIRELPVFEKEDAPQQGITVYTDFRLVLMGYAGDIEPKLQYKDIKIIDKGEKIVLTGEIKNIGERQGRYKVYSDEYFLGNMRVRKDETIKLEEYEFSYSKEEKYKAPKKIIIKDYQTEEIVETIKLK